MPVAAVSSLAYRVFTRFAPEREVEYEAAKLAIRSSGIHVCVMSSLEDIAIVFEECRTYMSERGVDCGEGVSVNDDGSWTLTMFGRVR